MSQTELNAMQASVDALDVPTDEHDPADDTGEESKRRPLMMIAPVVGLALLFGGWELYVRIADVRRLVLPTPSSVLGHIISEPGFYWDNAWVTISEAAWGFIAAFVIACAIAILMAHSAFVERATIPVIVLLQSTPVVALAPVFLNWFGFTAMPKVLVAALFTFPPFATNALTGFQSIDRHHHELLRSVDAGKREVFWKLRLPHALPYLFSAARICVALALVGAVVGELYGGSTEGLGYATRIGQTRLLIDQMWGSIFVLAFIGVGFTILVDLLSRRVLRWHSSNDRD
ncbi:MAG: ABC transporter permease [Actinomycetota bacterium]|nr:ABC transporter permease [Actinomycetota bacterium]